MFSILCSMLNFLSNGFDVHAGIVFSVAEGRTLLIPCESDRKQIWSFRKERTSRVIILSVFKNGTVIKGRDDPQGRFDHFHNTLEIDHLELEDSGKYLCNGQMVAKLTVTKGEANERPMEVIMT